MAIQVSCGNCGQEFRFRDEVAGKVFKCKGCGTKMSVPTARSEEHVEEEMADNYPPPPPRSRDRTLSGRRTKKPGAPGEAESSAMSPASRRLISWLVRLGAVLVLFGLAAWLVFSVKSGIPKNPKEQINYPVMWPAFFGCAYLGIPALVIVWSGVTFGPRTREVRIQGAVKFVIGLVFHIVGIGGNLLLSIIANWLIVIWYGIFFVGMLYMIAGLVMLVTGSTEGVASLLRKAEEK
jgi:hypothetical protein